MKFAITLRKLNYFSYLAYFCPEYLVLFHRWRYYSNDHIFHWYSTFKSTMISVSWLISRKFIEPRFYPDCARKELERIERRPRRRMVYDVFTHDNSYAPTTPLPILSESAVRYPWFLFARYMSSAGSPWSGRCILPNLLAKMTHGMTESFFLESVLGWPSGNI